MLAKPFRSLRYKRSEWPLQSYPLPGANPAMSRATQIDWVSLLIKLPQNYRATAARSTIEKLWAVTHIPPNRSRRISLGSDRVLVIRKLKIPPQMAGRSRRSRWYSWTIPLLDFIQTGESSLHNQSRLAVTDSQDIILRQTTILQMDDAIGYIQNPVIMSHHQNSCPLLFGEFLHDLDDFSSRFSV